jgi:hypothetical protein
MPGRPALAFGSVLRAGDAGSPRLARQWSRDHGLRDLRRLWTGELPLRTAFWTWAVAGGLLVNIATTLAFLALVSMDRSLAALVVGYGCSVPYNIVAVIGVWRSADRYAGDPIVANAARFVALLAMVLLSLT